MELVALRDTAGGLELQLTAPRANALEPGFLDAIRAGLDKVETVSPQNLLLTGGRNFCSGGDVARFAQAVAEGQGRDYALQVVPKLQEIVLRLLSLPSIVTVAARGAVTGGGAGLLFAADRAVLHPSCFVQPYYSQVGFAPDGGWAAILPEKIGAGRALSWLAQDQRVTAKGLVSLGLAEALNETPEEIALSDGERGSLQTAKRLVWDAARLAQIKARLQAETDAFLHQIEQPETLEGMNRFLHP